MEVALKSCFDSDREFKNLQAFTNVHTHSYIYLQLLYLHMYTLVYTSIS